MKCVLKNLLTNLTASIKFHSSSLLDSQVAYRLSLAKLLLLIHTFQTKQSLIAIAGWVLFYFLKRDEHKFLNGIVKVCVWEGFPSSNLQKWETV